MFKRLSTPTLHYNILLNKFEKLGIRGISQQNVFHNQNYSPFKSISKGVSQGSVLGLIFFLYTLMT